MFQPITFTCRIEPGDTLRVERQTVNAEEGLRFYQENAFVSSTPITSVMLNTAQLTKLRDTLSAFLGTESSRATNLWTEG